jgi:hypothetical protein
MLAELLGKQSLQCTAMMLLFELIESLGNVIVIHYALFIKNKTWQ